MTEDTKPDTGDTTDDATQGDEGDTPTLESLTAEVEKWKAQSRKHEDRAKANSGAQKELDKLREASMSDMEKAIEVAKSETRTAVLQEVATKLVDAEVRAAVSGRNIEADDLLEGLDRTRFVTEDGDVDRDALVSWVDRIAPKTEDRPTIADLGQGRRGTPALGSDPLLEALKNTVGAR